MDNTNIDYILLSLKKSKFRAKFHLKDTDIAYVNNKSIDVIRMHSIDFIEKRLAPAIIPNDGKQTPMRGHPVFIAQHATATCCRECLEKWHKIEKNKALSEEEKKYISDVIMSWIDIEMKK